MVKDAFFMGPRLVACVTGFKCVDVHDPLQGGCDRIQWGNRGSRGDVAVSGGLGDSGSDNDGKEATNSAPTSDVLSIKSLLQIIMIMDLLYADAAALVDVVVVGDFLGKHERSVPLFLLRHGES